MATCDDVCFRRRVAEAEVDLAFALLEKADRDLAADLNIDGVVSCAVPAPHSAVIAPETLHAALLTLVAALGRHVNPAAGVHVASAVSVADAGNDLHAANVETARSELLDALTRPSRRSKPSGGSAQTQRSLEGALMSIHDRTSTDIIQRCRNCTAESRIVLDSLEGGVARHDQTDAFVVSLAACRTGRATK
jgi:hypothetical protein